MSEAFIFDAVRTPRGKGKADGALHEVPTVRLAATALQAVRDRNDLDTHLVDDVILGCVDPIGEAGGNVARAAVFAADYGAHVPGMQINRFCASGLDAVNMAAAQVKTGYHDVVVAGGVESMSRVGIGASGGAWPVDPEVAVPSYFMPQGVSADLIATKYGISRDDCDAYAVESQKRTAVAWSEGRFARSVVPVTDINELILLDRDEHPRPTTDMQALAALNPSFEVFGQMGGFDAVAIQAHPEVEKVKHVHHAGNSSGIVDGAAAVLVANEAGGKAMGLTPRARNPRLRQYRFRSGADADRADRRDEEAAQALRHGAFRYRPCRDQRGLRVGGAALRAGVRPRCGEGERQRRRDRHGPSAWRDRRDDPRHRARRA